MKIQHESNGYKPGWISFTLAISQVFFLVHLIYSQIWINIGFWILIPLFFSAILAFSSINAMRRSRINILPDLLPGSKLITSGPYRFIRHPMYTSLLILFIPLVVIQYSDLRLLSLAGLLFVLIIKIIREENELKATFEDFHEYRSRTHYLIPWLL